MEWKVQHKQNNHLYVRAYVAHDKYYIDNYKYVEVDRPYDELTSTYFNVLEALLFIKSLNIKYVSIISPSRIIDELNTIVDFSDESFAQTMRRNILPYFIDISFEKCSEEYVEEHFRKAGEVFEYQSRNPDITKSRSANRAIHEHARAVRATKLRRSYSSRNNENNNM